jgi:hypothetical protein
LSDERVIVDSKLLMLEEKLFESELRLAGVRKSVHEKRVRSINVEVKRVEKSCDNF